MVKALIALSSYNGPFYTDGQNTGVFFVEAYHPYAVFEKAGVEVDFVSETGHFGWDEHSLSQDFLAGADRAVYEDAGSAFMKGVAACKRAADVDASHYDVFFAAGGHGCTFDFPHAQGLQQLALAVHSNGGVVAAVCHGPCIFQNFKAADGEYFMKGKKMTGFTNRGEEAMGLTALLEEKGLVAPHAVADLVGATYVSPNDPWDNFAVTDGRIVTGVNPQSATKTAEEALAVCKSS